MPKGTWRGGRGWTAAQQQRQEQQKQKKQKQQQQLAVPPCLAVSLSLLPHCPPTLCPTLAQCHLSQTKGEGTGRGKKLKQDLNKKQRYAEQRERKIEKERLLNGKGRIHDSDVEDDKKNSSQVATSCL